MDSKSKSTPDRRVYKWKTTLAPMANGEALTRFDAERFGEHTLNSTIPIFEGKGLTVAREWVKVPGRFGEIRCLRYSLSPAEQKRAQQLLASA